MRKREGVTDLVNKSFSKRIARETSGEVQATDGRVQTVDDVKAQLRLPEYISPVVIPM
jgi:hypothetical protein